MLASVVFDYVPMNVMYLTKNYLHLSSLHHVNDAMDDADDVDVHQSD
jgi:hypothetical protein